MTEEQSIEILEFFRSCGGVYQRHNPLTVYRILDCLDHGQYLLERGQTGEIIRACCYWKIWETDFEKAKLYTRPDNPYAGPVFYLTDFASSAGMNSLLQIAEYLEGKEPGTEVFCFERKNRLVVWDKNNSKIKPWSLRR